MNKEQSILPFNYVTIRTTKSRIDKGLLAIPVSIIDIFPKIAREIYIVDEVGNIEKKSFTPYQSSSRECRIGGMSHFYQKYNVKDKDELVIQTLDNDKFRIIPEKLLKNIVLEKLNAFETATNDTEINACLDKLSVISNISKSEIIKNEFVKLSSEDVKNRKIIRKDTIAVRESVNHALRRILLELYKGKCQVSDFSFIMKNGNPYFEIHHIDANKGNHLKNLLVVSPNVHAQFTHCNVEHWFDNNGWLRKVRFNNEREENVFQIIDKLPYSFEKEVHD